jgi:hypothetical protein
VGWTFFFMMVVLKLPIAALLWLVWWAARPVPDPPAPGAEDGGGPGRRPHPHPPLPRPPRRGPHGDAAPPAPPRVRDVVARERSVPEPHR